MMFHTSAPVLIVRVVVPGLAGGFQVVLMPRVAGVVSSSNTLMVWPSTTAHERNVTE